MTQKELCNKDNPTIEDKISVVKEYIKEKKGVELANIIPPTGQIMPRATMILQEIITDDILLDKMFLFCKEYYKN